MSAELPHPVITVVGSAAIRTQPDEAIVSLTLTALDVSPAEAFADLVGRPDSLASILDELGVPRSDRLTSGIQLQEEFDHRQEGRVSLGHRASASLVVRLTDNELIGQLATRAVAEAGAGVNGPRWSVSASNPARLEAARQAAADAKRRGQAYAAGADATVGRLLSLSESDPAHAPIRSARYIALAAGSGDMPIEAGEQDVTAVVEARFALNPA